MKKIKQIFWLVALVPLLYGQLGCKKFLDRKPLGQAIDGDVSGGGAQSQVFGLYSATRLWGMTGLAFLTMHG
ncbi:MAG: RagB/SusD family nutrient uptake outer membrane protein, partial [Bacteroidetes bacterium]|nr:RagB/SusD family nutrient uptake outer membrane protein [Bacteroidota bacterium]